MSDGDVSLIRDEDALRRMWQQTEDFSRKKEIRSHMYRLREERLRNLYSPEPTEGKGCEFTSPQGHVKSFADQSFQSMKSKEVRDAGSPPKEFAYRGQDLKELSNAGWNVDSEDRTTDDGRTHVKSVNANIEGRYDVEGGRGQFAAVDRQRQAVTEYHDDNSSLRRDEKSTDTAAHEHVVRQTDDGTRIASTTSSSNTSSKVQQVSSTKFETVPYLTDDDYDLTRQQSHDTNRNEQVTRITTRNDNEHNLRRNDFEQGELVSRKIEYPDDNTKVIVETRCLPDGTRRTSTRREFRAPVQSTRSESYKTKSESKTFSSQHKSDNRETSSKITRQTIDNRTNDIVDSQRNLDDHDFKRPIREYTTRDDDDLSNTQRRDNQRNETNINRKVSDYSQADNDYSQIHRETRVNEKVTDHSNTIRDDYTQTQHRTNQRNDVDKADHRQTSATIDARDTHNVDEVDQAYVTRDARETKRVHKIDQTYVTHDVHDAKRVHKIDQTFVTHDDRDTQRMNKIDQTHVTRDDRDTRKVDKVDRTYTTRDARDTQRVDKVDQTYMARDDRDTQRVDRNIHKVDNTVYHQTHITQDDRDTKIIDETNRQTFVRRDDRDMDDTNQRQKVITRNDRVNETDQRKIHISRDDRDLRKDVKETHRDTESEKTHKITKDTTVEEKEECKTSSDRYQTTYQNDYQQKKISHDWSPTHQAWASTLRSDTPSRPSTRASSPGSRTFKSSTSSLRSSVSPDKTSRKPSSRGGSPSKVDRYSPSRTVTSDRYSSTHSTHTVTETRTNKNTSPERKPPTGRSPTRPEHSPDRKPHDLYRQRPSVSPEKEPQTDRPSSSPDRKPSTKTPTDGYPRNVSPSRRVGSPKAPSEPRQSTERRPPLQPSDGKPSDSLPRTTSPYRSVTTPERKPADNYPNRSSPRSSPSPDRKPGYQKPSDTPTGSYPRTTSPTRPTHLSDGSSRKPETSPERKPSYKQPLSPSRQSPDKPIEKYPQDSTTKRPSVSPDRKPGYMRPTSASQPTPDTRNPSKPDDEPGRKSPSKQIPSINPDHKTKPQDYKKTTKIEEDHYRFVDEETKVYSRTDKADTHKKSTIVSALDDISPRDKSPSPIRKVPRDDDNDEPYRKINKTVETIDNTTKQDKVTEDVTTTKLSPKDKEPTLRKGVPTREASPTKCGTYDKKKPREVATTTEMTSVTTEDTKDVKYDSLTRRDKTSPKRVPDVPSSPTKKSPRDSTSPLKSPTKDTKYKHTTDFISTERTTEEINKKTTKERPRQLVTPSSSPTRKPKIETEPSTGQSSPTTSVSGFVYFGSPRTERPMVTDLDDVYCDTENPDGTQIMRPESLDFKGSPSKSKIPCRSPSPEKHEPLKESLPRKSSLKKPSTDSNLAPSIEKPPSSFRVSPTSNKPDVPGHKVLNKDQPGETGSPVKPKPPLTRRETYEDRCKIILGMVDDKTNTEKQTFTGDVKKHTNKPDSNESSTSVSPCESPVAKESSPFPGYPNKMKVTDTKIDTTNFMTHEKEDITKTTNIRDHKKSKIPSRESSPTKLVDIISKTTSVTEHDKTKKDVIEDTVISSTINTEVVKTMHPSQRHSSDKPIYQPSDKTDHDTYPHQKFLDDKPNDSLPRRPDQSPERKSSIQKPTDEYPSSHTSARPKGSSPSRYFESSPSRGNLSPGRHPTTDAAEHKPMDKYPKAPSPSRGSTKRTPEFDITTTTVTTKYDKSTVDNFQESNTKKTSTTSHPTRVLESPTRQIPRSTQDLHPISSDRPRTGSPSKPKDNSPERGTVSPDRTTESQKPRDTQPKPKSQTPNPNKPRESPEKKPDYIKTTTAISSKYDESSTTDIFDETNTSSTLEKKKMTKSSSPTRQTPQGVTRSVSPTKTSEPSSNSPIKQDLSPTRKPGHQPTKDVSAKTHGDLKPKDEPSTRSHEVPGYMRSTTATSSKYDTTSVSEVVHDSKTVEKKETISRPKDLPSRKIPAQPKSVSQHPRTPSPTKSTRPLDISPERKPGKYQQPSTPTKESTIKKPGDKHPNLPSPTRSGLEKNLAFNKTTKSETSKHDTTEYDSKINEYILESVTCESIEREYPTPKDSKSPTRKTAPEHLRRDSPTRPSYHADRTLKPKDVSPDRKPQASMESPDSMDKLPQDSSPNRPDQTPSYMKTTIAQASKFDSTSTTEDFEETTTSKNMHKKYPSKTPESLTQSPNTSEHPRTLSPSKLSRPADEPPKRSATSPERKPGQGPYTPETKRPKETTPAKSIVSPNKPSYMKPTASVISKYETEFTTEDTEDTNLSEIVQKKYPTPRPSASPARQSPERTLGEHPGYLSKPEETRQLRTPSPIKKITQVTEVSTDFLISEREQEILNKVQKSLRKLSPERKEKSPIRERSPTKTTTSLQDLDINTTETMDKYITDNMSEIIEEQTTVKSNASRPEKPKDKPNDLKTPGKPTSRNVSPTKKSSSSPSKLDKSPESPNKTRSISPRKPMTQERPQSPQVPKTSGIKPREPIPVHLTRKSTPVSLTTTNRLTTNTVTKQTVYTKTTSSKPIKQVSSPTSKTSEHEPKRGLTPKGVKDFNPKKDAITRTASETSMKPKKTSPQRMKSKPEIQISDMSTKSPKGQKPMIKEPHSKLPSKPKSATALNMSTDEDDIIIDVQQSKSSRENSPDRICPTPVNFADDVGTPRFPDEVSEPDDDFRNRTHHTIHETESVVDDIVEICEDEELFVRRSDLDHTKEQDDSLFSVNDKISKFSIKINAVAKPKDTTAVFRDTERRVHSDFVEENLKSDECLMSVSEKVNKFAKGPRETKDSRSPSRKITDEYDRDTVYTDDYTKLSVNDKAHLFVETAENVKVSKVKPVQKVERPDLSNVDESLKSDDCLLSVSDKVNKFVKTAEQLVTETQVGEDTERKIKEQHEKILKKIVNNDDEEIHDMKETVHETEGIDKSVPEHPGDKSRPRDKEPKMSQPKVKDNYSPKTKITERAPTVKITTLRSSEAVKKAKALFENIASTQKTEDTKTHITKITKLTDIGVVKKSPKTDSTVVLHPSVEDVSPQLTDVDSEDDTTPSTKDRPSSGTLIKPQHPRVDEKPRSSPNHLPSRPSDMPMPKSPMRQTVETTTNKTCLSSYPATTRAESPRQRPDDTPDKVPGYLRPTKTSQIKEETKVVEETDVSNRRGSGKFGVELRRTSVERSTVSSERRRSVEHHQPCIEDIFDLDFLEQMLEKVSGYEQRRRIRAQIRIVKNQSENVVDTHTYTKTTKQTTTTQKSAPKTKSPVRHAAKSPERAPKSAPQKTLSPDRIKSFPQRTVPDRTQPKEPTAPVMNGQAKEPTKTRQRPHSPEKPATKSTHTVNAPVRQPSPDKRRPMSPSKATPKPNSSRFNEYASAYMKKVGLNESNKVKFAEAKAKKASEAKQTVKHEKQDTTVQEFASAKSFTERTSSKDVIEIVQVNGKRSPSPGKGQSPDRKTQIFEHKIQSERRTSNPVRKSLSPDRKAQSPERRAESPERIYQRTPSPDFKRPKSTTGSTGKETIIKTVYDIDKKVSQKQIQEEKPSWVTNRNLKKITSETRTFSSKKIESEKPKFRAPSPSKVISKPIDVITSSYGPGPLDADGKPLFGIKALRNGATNFQVKGTVIRQEFHSRNGGEPEGTVSVTAYSSQPEELEQLLASQGAEPPSRIHGLAAITTTTQFGGDTGNSLSNVCTKENRASLEQFTHSDRKVSSRTEHLDSRSYDRRETSTDKRTDSKNRHGRREETELRRGKVDEKREKMERREDKKTVRQNSVKSLTEKYIKSANDSGKTDRSTYPKAGLILRTTTLRDSISSDDAHPVLHRADSEHSLCSVDDTVVTTTEQLADGVRTTTTRTTHHHGPVTTHTKGSTVITQHEPVITTKKTSTVIMQEPVITHRVVTEPVTRVVHEPTKVTQTRGGSTVTTERSFLDSSTKVTGVQDILTRMKNADIVIQEGDTTEDAEARALLNKFLGATVLMAGMQNYVAEQPAGKMVVKQETVRTSGGGKVSSSRIEEVDLDQCWDERLLRKLLDDSTDYEQRRLIRARIRTLMAEQEACASAVTEALGAAGAEASDGGEAREEEEVTVTSSVRRNSSEKTVSSSTSTKTSKVVEVTRSAPKPVSPFAKFRQLEKQNSTTSPSSPKTPQSPGSPSQPYFKFTDPALQSSALTIKERLLKWCRDKTRDYENVKLENFSTSWADGLAFCALIHHFLPNTFDYSKLTPDRRRHNFTLAFKVADEKAGIYPLLDVDDMVAMRKPDWKCVFTYVQSIYRRFKDED